MVRKVDTSCCFLALFLSSVGAFNVLPLQRHQGRILSSVTIHGAAAAASSDDQKKEEGSPPPSDGAPRRKVQPVILDPFPEAADPMYAVRGPVGEGDFVVSREGGCTPEELANENIIKIVRSECTDLEVNTLVWKGLGYRFNADKEEWDATECFPKWKEKYPSPTDFIGMQRVYSKDVDNVSLRSNQALVKSIPADNKQSLKEHMKPLGWKGYQYGELTPNLTRRAQCANWLIFYREELYGYTLEELKERRQRKKEAEELAKKNEGKEDEWTLPVKEVF